MAQYLKLKLYTTCDIADALVELGHTHFYIANLKLYCHNPYFSDELGEFTKVIGPAYTVQLVRADDTTSPRLNIEQHWLDNVKENEIVLISSPKNVPNAVFGGLLAERLNQLKAGGVIVSGKIRDLKELRSLGLTVFAFGNSILGAKGFTVPSTVNEPVFLPDVNNEDTIKVGNGDIIVADKDGVIVVPLHLVDAVIVLCQKLTKADAKCQEAIRDKGYTIQRAFDEFRNLN